MIKCFFLNRVDSDRSNLDVADETIRIWKFPLSLNSLKSFKGILDSLYFENPKSEKKEPGEWCGEHVCEVSSKSEHGKGV